MKYQKIQLKNGLTVLFIESHKSPVISVQMWCRTGSADESKPEQGISHFIEHLVFKGTPSFGVGEIARSVEGSGGELNAYTSFDQTVYYVTMPSKESKLALKVIREMTSAPLFDEVEVNNEREVVIEEIKRGLDSPGRVASQLLFSTVFKKHSYGVPVIGYEKIIKKVSIKTLRSYFEERYHPKNMFLVVAGNLTRSELKNELKDFEKTKNKKFRNVKRKKEPPQKSPRIKVTSTQFKDNYFHLGFRVPKAQHKDIPALEALAMILGQGDSSRLVHRLRIENHVANSIGSSLFSPLDEGLFLISGTYKEDKFKDILKEVFNSIIELRHTPVTDDELAKVKLNIESEQYFSLETVDGLSRNLGSWEFSFKDPSHFEIYLKQIQGLTPQRLQEVAKKWLHPEILTFVALSENPKEINSQFRSLFSSFKKDLKAKAKASKSIVTKLKSTKPLSLKSIKLHSHKATTEQKTLSSGATLVYRKITESPLISVRAAFLGGLRAESSNKRSVTELVSRTWIGDLGHLKESQIYNFFDARAAAIGSFSGRNSIGLNSDFLQSFERDCSKLWAEILTQPSFQSHIIEREKSVLHHQIQSRNDKGAQRAIMKLQEILFQGHPYQFDLLGSEESVHQVSVEDLHEYWNKVASPENLVISVSGHIDPQYWIDLTEDLTSRFKHGQRLNKSFTARPPLEPTTHHQILNREQTHIAIGFPGLSMKSSDRYALHIIDSLLSGQGGRLFIELRDKKSLAYSVGPIHMEGIETGYFGAYIGCSPDKAKKAIDMLIIEFQRLIKDPITQEELDKARRYIVGRHHIEMQKTNHINSLLLFDALYGMDLNEAFDLEGKYLAITPGDIQRVAREIFSRPPVICTVGPDPQAN